VNQKIHISLLERLKIFSKQFSKDFESEDRRLALPAAISHLLQTPGVNLPFVSDDLQQEIQKFLNKRQDENDNSVTFPDHIEEKEINKYTHSLLSLFGDIPYPPPENYDFRFIDLFAGIGGFRIAFQEAGGKCFFSSEWDKFSQQTYVENFGEIPYGDIQKIDEKEIPDHDVLCAGFPCQPFSIAGVSKKNSLGRKHGFDDETQGTLFFDIKRILEHKRPKAFMLENVKNLTSHDKGRTFKVIQKTLEKELGYIINWRIVDAGAWVPQHRERIFIVGYDPGQIDITKDEIIIPDKPDEKYTPLRLNQIIRENITDHTIGPGTWETLKRHKAHHAKAGNGFGYGMINLPIPPGKVTRTISARYHKDGAEILIDQPGERPRRLTISEAMQLQGYDPKRYRFPVSKTQAYRQIGNSVAVPAITSCAHEIAKVLKERGRGH
jgi:DNA (cytosine-5)-methyltransferase 1